MNTSKFAKLSKVTKRTLIHYDEIGLLKPDQVDVNGYREYSLSQLEKMDTIKIFQRAGFSLSEIKNVYDLDSSSMECKLKIAQSSIENKISELNKINKYIENKLRLFEEFKEHGDEIIFGKYMIYKDYPVITDADHFFSFLHDEFIENFSIDSNEITRLPACDDMKQIEGFSFYIKGHSEHPEILDSIKTIINENKLKDSNIYYLSTIPHALIDEKSLAIIRVIVPKV